MAFLEVLPEFLMGRRWFGGKARRIHAVEVSDVVPVCREVFCGYLVLVQVGYDTGPDDTYDIPLVRAPRGASQNVPDPASVLKVRQKGFSEDIVLIDALSDEQFLGYLLEAIAQGATFLEKGGRCEPFPQTRWLPLAAATRNACTIPDEGGAE